MRAKKRGANTDMLNPEIVQLSVPVEYVKRGAGKDILFIHGLNAGWKSFAKVLPLIKKGYCCWAFDFPEYGECRLADYVQIAHEFIKKMKLKQPVLVGHSMGGLIVLKLAKQCKADKIFLVSAPLIARPLTALHRVCMLWKLASKVHLVSLVSRNIIRRAAQDSRIREDQVESFLQGLMDVLVYIPDYEHIRDNSRFYWIYGTSDILLMRKAMRKGSRLLQPEKVFPIDAGHAISRTRPEEMAAIINSAI